MTREEKLAGLAYRLDEIYADNPSAAQPVVESSHPALYTPQTMKASQTDRQPAAQTVQQSAAVAEYKQDAEENPTRGQRLANIFKGATGSSAASYADALRANYESGQGGRTQRMMTDLRDIEWGLAQAMYAQGQDAANPANANAVAEWQRKLDAYTTTLGDGARDMAMAEVNDAVAKMGSGTADLAELYRSLAAFDVANLNGVQQKATAATAEMADTMQETASQHIADAKQGLGKAGQTAVDFGVAAVQLAGDRIVKKFAGPAAAKAMLASRAFGSGTAKARQEGKALGTQIGLGASTAALELTLERLFDGLAGVYGKGAADEIVEELVSKWGKSAGAQNALRILFGFAGESVEEGLSAVANPKLEVLWFGEEWGDRKASLNEILHDALIGGLLGAGSTGAKVATDSVKSAIGSRLAPPSSGEALNGDAATTVTPQAENGTEGEISPHSDGAYTPTDPLAAIVSAAQEGRLTNRQVRTVALSPEDLQRLGIDTNGKTASQIRAEVRAALDARAAADRAPTNDGFLDEADGGVESDSGVAEQPAVVGATQNATDTPRGWRDIARSVPNWEGYSESIREIESQVEVGALREVIADVESGLSRGELAQKSKNAIAEYESIQAAKEYGESYTAAERLLLRMLSNQQLLYDCVASDPSYVKTLKALLEDDSTLDSASATQQPTSASTAQESAQTTQTAQPNPESSVGAAERGFSPYSSLELEYGVHESGEHPVRSDDVPISTNGTDRVSRSVVTMKGAEAIPDSRIETIEQAVVEGKFSHIPIPNNVASRRARDSIRNKGFDRALQDFLVNVRSGKAGAVLTATGVHLLNNAANSNMSGADFIELATACAQMLRNSSQGTQAWRILKQLTPEARLYQINREIARYNDENAARSRRSTLPTWLWMDRVGGELAQRMAAVAKGKSEDGVKTVTQTVLQDLYARAIDASGIKRGASNRRRTNIEQLQDIFRNYENYSEAWNEAKETIRREFGDDPAVMDALEEWMDAALDVTDALSREITGREDIKLNKDLAERYLAAETEEQRDAVLEEMKQDVGRQMKASGMDKLTALRYTNMLGNFRTNVRNFGGNLGMTGLRVVHNAIATSLERLAGTERTRSLVVSKEYMDVGRSDFDANKREAMGEDKYKPTNAAQGFMRDAREHMRIFTSRGLGTGLEAYHKGTQWLMNNNFFGDEAFARHAYARALAGYLKAQGITAEQFGSEEWQKEHTEAADKARAFAVNEAREATFRDNTALAEALVNLRVAGNGPMAKALNVMGDGLLPFRKTPANVLSRVMEYSPLGIGKTLLDAAMKGASNTALADREGALGDFARSGGDISGADIVNELAKGLTGTGLLVLGMLLRAGGYLRGKEDDEKRAALEELDGHQDYSLELPDGTSLTVDWFTPASMTLFMGAELMDIINEEGTAVKGVVDALMSVADPMIEMSMLQGIDDTLDNIRDTEGSSVLTIAATLALNYLFQATTNTLFGQLERTVTGESTMTHVDKESPISPWLQKEIGKASRKAPGDYNQIPYIDEWGRVEETGDVLTRAVNNLFNPGYVSRVENDAVNKELRRLYEKTGEGGVVPSRAEKSFTVGGEQRNLTAEEYVKYATTLGQTRYRYVQEAINSSYYKSLSDDAKASYIGNLYSYANYKAKREIEPKYDNTTYAKVAQAEAAGVSPLQYFKMKDAADADGNGSISQAEAKPYLDSQTELSNKQRDVLWSIINSSWKTNPYR